MRHSLLLASAVLALSAPTFAQDPFYSDFDGVPNGTPFDNVDGWFGWDNVSGVAGLADNSFAYSAPNSIWIGPNIDAVRPNIGATSGRWRVSARQYIPTGGLASGSVYFILNSQYNVSGPYVWTCQLQCNGTTIDDDLRASSMPVDLVFDAWAEICADIDLDADTVVFTYNGQVISEGVYSNGGPTELQNIDLYVPAGTCYFDDVKVERVSEENFDSYAAGSAMNGVNRYSGFVNSAAAAGIVDPSVSSSPTNSMRIGPGLYAVQDGILGFTGEWTFSANTFIASGGLSGGTVGINVNNAYDPGTGSIGFATQLTCSGTTIDDGQRASTAQPLVFDRWVPVRMDIDLDAGTISHFYNNRLISTGSYSPQGGPNDLAAIGFQSNGGTINIDDVVVEPTRKARAEVYGTGCAGSNGASPAISAIGRPSSNDPTFAIELSQATPNANAVLLLSGVPGNTPLGGCTLLLGLPADTVTSLSVSATGTASLPVPVPAGIAPGTNVYLQWGVLDPGATYLNILAFSDGLRLIMGR